MTYYNHTITLNEETNLYDYDLCGWSYSVATLEEAKKDIKQNWRQSQYFYTHCC